MSPKSFIQFHPEGKKILRVQVRCLHTQRHRDRPGPRGGPTRGVPPKNCRAFTQNRSTIFEFTTFGCGTQSSCNENNQRMKKSYIKRIEKSKEVIKY